MIRRHVQTIFCDDIREEVSGKLTYVGVYSSKLWVPFFPVVLPKLCLAVSIFTPATQPFRKLSIKIFEGDELVAENGIDEIELEKFADAFDEEDGSDKVQLSQLLRTQFIFSPLKIEEPTKLRVRVQTAEEELTGAGLRIEQKPEK